LVEAAPESLADPAPQDSAFTDLRGLEGLSTAFRSTTASTPRPATAGAPALVMRDNARYVVGIHNDGSASGNTATRINAAVKVRACVAGSVAWWKSLAGGACVRFVDVVVNVGERYVLGMEEESGRHYVAIPVSNGLVDYEEYYTIDRPTFDCFLADPVAALAFVVRCRARELDDRLMIPPGSNRGVAG
jgi:hypothetical protein